MKGMFVAESPRADSQMKKSVRANKRAERIARLRASIESAHGDFDGMLAAETELIDAWREQYLDLRPTCQELTYKLRNLVSDVIRNHGIDTAQIESRTKTIESFVEKARRDGKRYADPIKDITDLVGLRIIAYDKEEVDAICELIEREFTVDFDNSTDKARALELDRFGYLSIHYVVSLSKERAKLTEWQPFADLKAELQIRTVLQHAWAAIDHRFRYKTTNEIPTHLRRKLFRLSALLELADEEFLNLKRLKAQASRDYENQVEAGELDMELNLTSLEAYFTQTKEHEYWARVSRSVGFKEYTPPADLGTEVQDISRRRLLQILKRLDVTSLEEVADALEGVHDEGKEILGEVCEATTKLGLTPLAIPYVVVGILILFAFRERLTPELLHELIDKSPLVKPIEQVLFGEIAEQ